jgi:hypothetical protein
MLDHKIVNDRVILWVRDCPHTHLFNIPTRTLEADTTYTFWHKAIGHSSHDLIKYVKVFPDSDLILSTAQNFDYDFYL